MQRKGHNLAPVYPTSFYRRSPSVPGERTRSYLAHGLSDGAVVLLERDGSVSKLSDRPPARGLSASVGPRPSRVLVHGGLAVLVSGGLLAMLFATQGVDLRALASVAGTLGLPGLGAFVLVSGLALFLGSWRNWLLLEQQAPVWPLVLVTLVRNLFVHLLPARTGAAASYLYLVTRRLGLPIEAALASMVVAFLLDTVALVPLLLVAVVFTGGGLFSPRSLILVSLGILAGSLVAVQALEPTLRRAARLAERGPRRLTLLAAPLRDTAEAVRRLQANAVLGPALALSVVIRLAKYGAYYALLQAVLIGQGYGWESLSVGRTFLSIVGAELAASLPVPTVASLGPYEAAGALGFVYWLGLPQHLATVAITVFHGVAQLYDDGLGLLALLWILARPARSPISCRTGEPRDSDPKPPPR